MPGRISTMFRRSVIELSLRRRVGKIPTKIVTQLSPHFCSRKEFSVQSQTNASPEKPSNPRSFRPKFLVGTAALGAAFLTAYQTGYLDRFLQKEPHSNVESDKVENKLEEVHDLPRNEGSEGSEHPKEQLAQESKVSVSSMDQGKENKEAHLDLSHDEDLHVSEGEDLFEVKEASKMSPTEDIAPIQEKESISSLQEDKALDDVIEKSSQPLKDIHDVNNIKMESHAEQRPADNSTLAPTQADKIFKENDINQVKPEVAINEHMPEDDRENILKQAGSLLDEYYLRESADVAITSSAHEPKVLDGAPKDMNDAHIDKNGKLVLDFLQAIHTAEKRQAELDAIMFAKEKRKLKEKYETELKDARARELMYAEREAILEKELDKEKLKAAAALKSLQEKLEEKHKTELEKKEADVELELKKIQALAKAELDAAIAREKASQIEKMAEANLHINALCMAFYARSHEARQTHSIHKLALGALALEDALSKGLPIKEEIDALHTHVEDIEKDSLLDLVLSSLPEEAITHGTDTQLQLTHKFDTLKGVLRHYSLIPPGGGGILAHSLAHVASWLKVREVDESGDGIESLMNRVGSLLAEGKLIEAADTLEKGVQGSQAAEIIGDWVKQVRNRAITEQALTLLQSYATSVSLS